MGTGLRVFLVKDDDSIERFPLARYERLLQRHPDEYLAEFAGKRVRYALVALDLENRKPSTILQIQYSFLSFDSEGQLDTAAKEKEIMSGLDMLAPLNGSEDKPEIIDARHRFAKKRYHNEYSWKPSPEIETSIVRAIFGGNLNP